MIRIDFSNEQTLVAVDEKQIREAVRAVLQDAGLRRGQISLAIVDDATISQLHQQFLQVDEPTDVLSFVLEQAKGSLEGEVIVSAETACLTADWYGWSVQEELLLYVIHGTLHLVGYDDTTAPKKAIMRQREAAYLAKFGIEGRFEEADVPPKKRKRGGKKASES